MENKNNKKKITAENMLMNISPTKKKIFFVLTLLFPLFLLIILEICLRFLNYGGDLRLFIDGPPGYENYLRCNPNVARRYFTAQSAIPTPINQLFLRNKPENGYRIFVLGESSTAGFPYGANASFPNILQRGLANTFPLKRIEVINLAMSAINTYTLLDFMDEIFEQSPDAILIYTGHNEYYGALGVGSTQSLGPMRWLVRTYIKLRTIRSFLLLRDFFGWLKIQASRVFYSGSQIEPSATLMEAVVAEQSIPYGSQMYNAGVKQFKENMEEILTKAINKNIKVVISELVSNVRDQKPFISVGEKEEETARYVYDLARVYETNEEYEKAKENYNKAKDLDALRFRASEDFNSILRDLSKKYSIPIVPLKKYFEDHSPHKLIGNNLMFEHLHPNKEGYYLIAEAFYLTLQENCIIADTVMPLEFIQKEKFNGITVLDSIYTGLVIKQLKGGWPFQPKGIPNTALNDFIPKNRIEEIALRVLPSKNFNIEAGHMELGNYYEQKGELDSALAEYNALLVSIPVETEFYQKVVTVLLKKQQYEKAEELLKKSILYKENTFAYKWIGQIALMKNDYSNAIKNLLKADLWDSQVIFNLSRAYYLSDQWEQGENYYQKLIRLAPNSNYTQYLKKLRIELQLKQIASNKKSRN